MKKNLIVTVFTLLFIMCSAAFSQNEGFASTEYAEEPVEEHSFSPYHIGLFLGMTYNFDHEANDFSLGLDYEYRLPYADYLFGTGLIIEAVFADHKESILAVPLFIHPHWGHLKFVLAPGVIFGNLPKDDDSDDHLIDNKNEVILSDSGEEVETVFQAHFLFRMGVGYDFHIDRFAITPSVAFDFFHGNTSFVYGLTFGMSL